MSEDPQSARPGAVGARDPREVLSRPYPPPHATLTYGPEAEHVADLWLPLGTGTPAPLVVVVHGGFWQAEHDRRHTGPMCADLADRGLAVASVEYRRVGQHGGGWPGTLDDVAAALDAVPTLAAEAVPASVDPDRVVLLGHSAGGHLVLWAAGRHRLAPTSRWHRPDPLPVSGVVALAGVCDLAQGSALGLGDGAVDSLLDGSAASLPDRVAQASPSSLLPLGTRVLLVHGQEDDRVPVEVSRDFAVRAERAGDDVSLLEIADLEHFSLIDPQSGAWAHVLEAVTRALG